MALTTNYYTTVKTVDSGYSGVDKSQATLATCHLTAKRSSLTSKNVTISIDARIGFKTDTGSTDNDNYTVEVVVGSKVDKTLTYPALGTNNKSSGSLSDSAGSKAYGIKKVTGSSTVSWYGTDTLSVMIRFKQNGVTKQTSSGSAIRMPDYDASGGSSGGGGDTSTPPSITSVTISPSEIYLGDSATLSYTGNLGTYSKAYVSIVGNGVSNPSPTHTTSPFSGSVTLRPTTIGRQEYSVGATGSSSGSVLGKGYYLNVKEKIVPNVDIWFLSPSSVDAVSGGSVTIYVDTSIKNWAYSVNSPYTSSATSVTGKYYASTQCRAGDTIYVWGYDNGKFSSGYDSAVVGTTYTVTMNNCTISPEILKQNTATASLSNYIKSGYCSATSTGGSVSYSWEYCEASTSGGTSSATWKSLGVGGSSFSDIDMSQKVTPGYYYKIRAVATGSLGGTDYMEASCQQGTIFQIPKSPAAATVSRVIAKADPSEGFNEIIQDGKKYYGSGLFLLWTNPQITDSHMPIDNIEIIYQSKLSTDTLFGETQYTQIAYWDLFENGELKHYELNKNSLAPNGGGADLEVSSLRETKVGIRITDTLGQSTDSWYTVENFYKAESPTFGGNIVVTLNPTGNPKDTGETFRPFSCTPTNNFTISTSVARSAAQDALNYYIDCYIEDRKETIHLLSGAPISTATMDNTQAGEGTILWSDENIVVEKASNNTIRYSIKNSYLKQLLLEKQSLRSPKNNGLAIYNDDFTKVTYKAYVKDNFDSRSTVYSSSTSAIKFIEAPSLTNNNKLYLGVNRFRRSGNPFLDNSVMEPISTTGNLDRIVNPGEDITFRFKRALDPNGVDAFGDVTEYYVYINRGDTPPQSYNDLNYTLLKKYSADLYKENPDLVLAKDDYYYLKYPIDNYNESKFITFKIEAVDSRGEKSAPLYADTYLVPCRTTQMDFNIASLNLAMAAETKKLTADFRINLKDLGGAIFANNNFSYKNFANFERSFSVGAAPNIYTFGRMAEIIFEGSLDGEFKPGDVTLTRKEGETIQSKSLPGYFKSVVDLDALIGDKLYPEGILENIGITDFPASWAEDWALGEKKFIKKIFFQVTYRFASALDNPASGVPEEKYVMISTTSAPYSYYDDAPTMSYRNHQVGINTKDFAVEQGAGSEAVLIVQDNGTYNTVVFKGAEQKLILSLTERTFYVENATGIRVSEISFDNANGKSPEIRGMKIDGGSW